MSNAEILAELPKLKAEERREIYQRLCELQEQDLLSGAGPSEEEKKLLDAALAEYETDRLCLNPPKFGAWPGCAMRR